MGMVVLIPFVLYRNFRQLACLARCNGAKVQDFYADDADW